MSEPQFGRIQRFDERSRNFPVATDPDSELPLRPYTWRPGRVLDQIGSSCTWFTKGSEFLARPAPVPDELITDELLMKGYHEAQHRDPWPGCYLGRRCPIEPSPDQYGGSSVLAALQVAVEWGWAEGYDWAFHPAAALYGIGHRGPAMTGSWWWSGMMVPSPDGRIVPTGQREGGHETLWNRTQLVWLDPRGPRRWANLDLDQSRVWNRQAWGDWGPLHGDAWMTVRDFAKIQHDEGEVAFFRGRRSIPKPHAA